MANFKYTPHEQRAIYAQMQRKKHERDLTLLQLTALIGDVTTMAGSGNILPPSCDAWSVVGDMVCTGGKTFTSAIAGAVGQAFLLDPYKSEIIPGNTYRVTFTLSNYTGGTLPSNGFRFYFGASGNSAAGIFRTSNGTFTQNVIAPAVAGFQLQVYPDAGGILTNLSVVNLGLL